VDHYPGSASFAAVKGIIIVSANFVIETKLRAMLLFVCLFLPFGTVYLLRCTFQRIPNILRGDYEFSFREFDIIIIRIS
jgi:hypothetical protein